MKISLMTSLTMMVMGPGSPPVRAFLHVLKYPLIVLVDVHVMESQNPFVVSVEYSQSEYFPLKNFSSFKFRILNMITVCCRFDHSFKTMTRREPVVFEVFPPRTVQRISSGRGGKGNVWFTRCIKGREPEIYELWTFDEDGIREVHPFVWVQISDDFTGETFHTHFSMQEQFEFLSWAAYPSTEVFNGSIFLNHLVKLELLPRLGLKTSTLTPGLLWIALLGVRTAILSTWEMLHAASVKISLILIVFSGFKLFSERPSRDVSRTLVTMSCPMTTGSRVIGLIDNFLILSVMWVSNLGSLLGSTCYLESLIVSTWSYNS